jgi:hypothetical protein
MIDPGDSIYWNWSYNKIDEDIEYYEPVIRKWTEWQWMSIPMTADDIIDTMLFIKRIKER